MHCWEDLSSVIVLTPSEMLGSSCQVPLQPSLPQLNKPWFLSLPAQDKCSNLPLNSLLFMQKNNPSINNIAFCSTTLLSDFMC